MYSYDSNGTAQKIIVNPLTKKEPVVEAYGDAKGYGDIIVNPLFNDENKDENKDKTIKENFEMNQKCMKNWCVISIVFLILVFLFLLFKSYKNVKSSFNPRFGYKFF